MLEQKKLHPKTWPEKSSDKLIKILLKFAEELDNISSAIVHGDITKKNLILDSNKLYLIDWEPCLKQIRRGYSTLLYTEPYRSLNDIKNNILSYETDKIAFFFSCLFILYRRRPLGVLRKIVLDRIKLGICMTPISENKFVLLTFTELVKLAIDNKKWKLY